MSVNKKLYLHQTISINNMERLEERSQSILDRCTEHHNIRLGINADPHGHGKTLSMVCLMAYNKLKWDTTKPYEVKTTVSSTCNFYQITRIKKYTRFNTNLVVASASVLGQWEIELDWVQLKYIKLTTPKQALSVNPDLYDVVLVSVGCYNTLVHRFENCAWKRIIHDEPQTQKTTSLIPAMAGFFWFVTANPDYVLSSRRCSMFGSSLYDMNIVLSDIIVKNTDEIINMSIGMPNIYSRFYNCHSQTTTSLKNIDGALSTESAIQGAKKLECFITDNPSELYGTQGCVTARIKDSIHSTCPICYGTIKDPIMEISCCRIFCFKCLLTWLQKNPTCPICRLDIELDDLVFITNDPSQTTKRSKNIQMIEIIKNHPDSKFIIYSGVPAYNHTICKYLTRYEIQGDTTLLLSLSKTINMTEKTDLIVYNDVRSSVLVQLLGLIRPVNMFDVPLMIHYL